MSGDTCQVCKASSSKYRCSDCKLKSCSLPCFKSHQAICEAKVQETAVAGVDTPRPQPVSNKSTKSLEQEVTELFQQQPQLRRKLKAIYEETLDPSTKTQPAQRARSSRFEARWTEEKGFQQGMKLLKAKLEANTLDTEDLAAFVDWVRASQASPP